MTVEAVAWNTRARDQREFPIRLREVSVNGGIPVVGLMEVNGGRRHVAAFARRFRYDMFPGVEWDEETGSSQLLVSRDVEVVNSGVIRFLTPWWGPKGGRHDGRAFPWAAVRNDDGSVTVWVLAHMIWGPFRPRNWRAHVAELRALRRFCEARRGVDIAIVMDANQSWKRIGLGSMRAFARQIGGHIVTTGATIDYGIYRPAPRPARPLRAKRLRGRAGGKYGSDHPACRYDEVTP